MKTEIVMLSELQKIKKALEIKHSGEIYIPECKLGATWGHGEGPKRIDFWSIKPSWANPRMTAYEIKVNRSDFLQDDKWRAYLDYCDQFYFICPSGLIEKTELPPEAGLMYLSKTGTRIFTKKKAPLREVDIPVNILFYILMWRSGDITRSRTKEEKQQKNIEYWKKWLEKRQAELFGI